MSHSDSHDWLTVHHAAKMPERARMVVDLELPPAPLLLDAGCGGCDWYPILSSSEGSEVVSLDRHVTQRPGIPNLIQGDLCQLPLAEETFDAIWCANSLMYLRDPIQAIHEFHRCLRIGGLLALKEEDSSRDILLPISEELDVDLRVAWRRIAERKPTSIGNTAIGRFLPEILSRENFSEVRTVVYPIVRKFPFSVAVRAFVTHAYLDYFDDYASILNPGSLVGLVELLKPGPNCLFERPGAEIVFVESVSTGRRCA